jgi:hypothetical protein
MISQAKSFRMGRRGIKPVPLHIMIDQYDFVPQAIIAETVHELAKRCGCDVENGQDDLDAYQGAAAWLDGFPFALMHYRGHPTDTSTIYLPFDIGDVDTITDIVSRIVSELKVSPKSVTWQRKDNPAL